MFRGVPGRSEASECLGMPPPLVPGMLSLGVRGVPRRSEASERLGTPHALGMNYY